MGGCRVGTRRSQARRFGTSGPPRLSFTFARVLLPFRRRAVSVSDTRPMSLVRSHHPRHASGYEKLLITVPSPRDCPSRRRLRHCSVRRQPRPSFAPVLLFALTTRVGWEHVDGQIRSDTHLHNEKFHAEKPRPNTLFEFLFWKPPTVFPMACRGPTLQRIHTTSTRARKRYLGTGGAGCGGGSTILGRRYAKT